MDAAALLADVEAKPQSLAALSRAADEHLLAQAGPFLEPRFRRYRFIGMGASHLAAEHAAARLRSLGVDAAADLASSRYGYPMDVATLTVAVSASGATSEVLAAVERLDGHFAVLALTEDADSPLTRLAGAVLPLTAGPGAGTCRTFLHTCLLLHGLTLVWTGGLPRMVARDVAVLADRVAAATGDLLERRQDWLPAAAAALDGGVRGPITVVAPAERLAAAHWSAQVLRTGPRRPALSAETADWLHSHAHLTAGPELGDRALMLLGSRADHRVLDRLADRGAALVAVGDDAERAVSTARGRAAGVAAVAAVEFPDDHDTDVARLTAGTVAELVAASFP